MNAPVSNKPFLTGNYLSDVKDNQTTISQQAEIGGKKVTITLKFAGVINNPEQIKNAMENSLVKLAKLAEAFKFGNANEAGEVTHSLILNKEGTLTRNYTYDKPHVEKDANAVNGGTKNKSKEVEGKAPIENSQKTVHVQVLTKEQLKEFFAIQNIANKTISNPENHEEEGPFEKEVEPDSKSGFPSSKEFTQILNQEMETPLEINEITHQTTQKVKSQEPEGKTFHAQFKVGDKIIATEKALREDTVPVLFKGLETKIAQLTIKLETEEAKGADKEEQKIQNLKKHIEKAKTDLSNYAKGMGLSKDTAASQTEITHASVNMARFAFAHLGRETAKEQMAPVLCNLRMQTVEFNGNPDPVSALTRSGAISDFTHGEVSLQELKDLPDLEKFESLSKSRKEQLQSLYIRDDKTTLGEVALLIKTKAIIGYGKKALALEIKPKLLESSLDDILKKLKSSKRIEVAFNKLSLQEKELLLQIKIDPILLNNVVEQRMDKLKLLVLQDLQLHFKTTKVKSEKLVHYGRTAVVDLQKKPNNESGCIIHERTQGLDMKAIFEELEGAEISFDTKIDDAYIDEEGKIHMPAKTCAEEGVTKATLNPIFFNICVQGSKGHVLNDGMQKSINDRTLAKLKMQFPNNQRLKNLEESLNKLSESEKNDPNGSVVLVTKFLKEVGGYPGINCFGGKDRTAYAVAAVTHSYLEDNNKKKGTLKLDLKKAGFQLLRPDGVAGSIAKDNSGATTLKLSRINLKLFDTSTKNLRVMGKMLRAAFLMNGLGLIIQSKIKGLMGKPKLAMSGTKGQIYKKAYLENIQKEKVQSNKQKIVSVRKSMRLSDIL